MDKFLVEDIFDVADLMNNLVSTNKDITFCGNYEDTASLIKALALIPETYFESIDLEPVELDGYDKEYYTVMDSDGGIWISKAYRYENESYLYHETDFLLVADDCNSKILDYIDYNKAIEICYDIEDDELISDDESGCENCPDRFECEDYHKPVKSIGDDHKETTRVAVDDDGVIRGFHKTWETKENGMTYKSSYTHYSNDQEMLKSLMENFDIKI